MSYCVYRNPDNKVMAGPYDTRDEAQAWIDESPYDVHDKYFVDEEIAESVQYVPMQLLKELFVVEEKKPSLKKAARSVYHRDYMKTKKKPYRQYDPREHRAESKGE